jgi:hypothetical protein
MVKSLISKYLAKIGRRGGKARLKTMTPEERRDIATKASKARRSLGSGSQERLPSRVTVGWWTENVGGE